MSKFHAYELYLNILNPAIRKLANKMCAKYLNIQLNKYDDVNVKLNLQTHLNTCSLSDGIVLGVCEPFRRWSFAGRSESWWGKP